MGESVIKEYEATLAELKINSKPLINILTMRAEENAANGNAPEIARLIENRLQKAPSNEKLPILYLTDSIVKNIKKGPYQQLFAKNLTNNFCGVFAKVNEKTRASLFKLRSTWNQYFASGILHALDVRVQQIDPAWPIMAPSVSVPAAIHINPKFIKKPAPMESTALATLPTTSLQSAVVETPKPTVAEEIGEKERIEQEMRQSLIAKQKELLQIQQQRLQLELEETKVKLATQARELKEKNEAIALQQEQLSQMVQPTEAPATVPSATIPAQGILEAELKTPIVPGGHSLLGEGPDKKGILGAVPGQVAVPTLASQSSLPSVSGSAVLTTANMMPTAAMSRNPPKPSSASRDPRLARDPRRRQAVEQHHQQKQQQEQLLLLQQRKQVMEQQQLLDKQQQQQQQMLASIGGLPLPGITAPTVNVSAGLAPATQQPAVVSGSIPGKVLQGEVPQSAAPPTNKEPSMPVPAAAPSSSTSGPSAINKPAGKTSPLKAQAKIVKKSTSKERFLSKAEKSTVKLDHLDLSGKTKAKEEQPAEAKKVESRKERSEAKSSERDSGRRSIRSSSRNYRKTAQDDSDAKAKSDSRSGRRPAAKDSPSRSRSRSRSRSPRLGSSSPRSSERRDRERRGSKSDGRRKESKENKPEPKTEKRKSPSPERAEEEKSVAKKYTKQDQLPPKKRARLIEKEQKEVERERESRTYKSRSEREREAGWVRGSSRDYEEPEPPQERRPAFRRPSLLDPNIKIPQELSLSKLAKILEQAEKQLHSGALTHDQHQQLLRELNEIYNIQRQKKEDERLARHGPHAIPPREDFPVRDPRMMREPVDPRFSRDPRDPRSFRDPRAMPGQRGPPEFPQSSDPRRVPHRDPRLGKDPAAKDIETQARQRTLLEDPRMRKYPAEESETKIEPSSDVDERKQFRKFSSPLDKDLPFPPTDTDDRGFRHLGHGDKDMRVPMDVDYRVLPAAFQPDQKNKTHSSSDTDERQHVKLERDIDDRELGDLSGNIKSENNDKEVTKIEVAGVVKEMDAKIPVSEDGKEKDIDMRKIKTPVLPDAANASGSIDKAKSLPSKEGPLAEEKAMGENKMDKDDRSLVSIVKTESTDVKLPPGDVDLRGPVRRASNTDDEENGRSQPKDTVGVQSMEQDVDKVSERIEGANNSKMVPFNGPAGFFGYGVKGKSNKWQTWKQEHPDEVCAPNVEDDMDPRDPIHPRNRRRNRDLMPHGEEGMPEMTPHERRFRGLRHSEGYRESSLGFAEEEERFHRGPRDFIPDHPHDFPPNRDPRDFPPERHPREFGHPRDFPPDGHPHDFPHDVHPHDFPPDGPPRGFPPGRHPRDFHPEGHLRDFSPEGIPRDFPSEQGPHDFPPEGPPRDFPPGHHPRDFFPEGHPRDFAPEGHPGNFPPEEHPQDFNPRNIPPNMDPRDPRFKEMAEKRGLPMHPGRNPDEEVPDTPQSPDREDLSDNRTSQPSMLSHERPPFLPRNGPVGLGHRLPGPAERGHPRGPGPGLGPVMPGPREQLERPRFEMGHRGERPPFESGQRGTEGMNQQRPDGPRLMGPRGPRPDGPNEMGQGMMRMPLGQRAQNPSMGMQRPWNGPSSNLPLGILSNLGNLQQIVSSVTQQLTKFQQFPMQQQQNPAQNLIRNALQNMGVTGNIPNQVMQAAQQNLFQRMQSMPNINMNVLRMMQPGVQQMQNFQNQGGPRPTGPSGSMPRPPFQQGGMVSGDGQPGEGKSGEGSLQQGQQQHGMGHGMPSQGMQGMSQGSSDHPMGIGHGMPPGGMQPGGPGNPPRPHGMVQPGNQGMQPRMMNMQSSDPGFQPQDGPLQQQQQQFPGIPSSTSTAPAVSAAPAAPTSAVSSQFDINSLFSKLISSGIIKDNKPASPADQSATPPPTAGEQSKEEAKEKGKEEEAGIDKEDTDSQDPEDDGVYDIPEIALEPVELKVRHPGLVKRMYSGLQCTSCGQRFVMSQMDRYRKHLDWHFRQNRKKQDGIKATTSRKWYYDVDEWLEYEEINDTEDARSTFFEDQAQEYALKDQGDSSVPVTNNPNDEFCKICRETFEQFFNEETEEWHLRDSVRIDDRTFHPSCYEDAKDTSSFLDASTEDLLSPPIVRTRNISFSGTATSPRGSFSSLRPPLLEEEKASWGEVKGSKPSKDAATEPTKDAAAETDKTEPGKDPIVPKTESGNELVPLKTEPNATSNAEVEDSKSALALKVKDEPREEEEDMDIGLSIVESGEVHDPKIKSEPTKAQDVKTEEAEGKMALAEMKAEAVEIIEKKEHMLEELRSNVEDGRSKSSPVPFLEEVIPEKDEPMDVSSQASTQSSEALVIPLATSQPGGEGQGSLPTEDGSTSNQEEKMQMDESSSFAGTQDNKPSESQAIDESAASLGAVSDQNRAPIARNPSLEEAVASLRESSESSGPPLLEVVAPIAASTENQEGEKSEPSTRSIFEKLTPPPVLTQMEGSSPKTDADQAMEDMPGLGAGDAEADASSLVVSGEHVKEGGQQMDSQTGKVA